jgi:hypothetical protein
MNLIKIIDVVLMIFKLINSVEFKAIAVKIIEFLKSLEEANPESVAQSSVALALVWFPLEL